MAQLKNKGGQFVKTTGTTTYKAVQYLGKRMGEHNRNFCVLLNIDSIPKGFVVHHINGDKNDNDMSNLALMTYGAHNKIHSKKKVWNKGIKAINNEKWNEIIKKAVKSRKGHYVAKKGKEVYELKLDGLSFRQISVKLGISRETASRRLQSYLNFYQIISPDDKKRIDYYKKIKELRYDKSMTWEQVAKEINSTANKVRMFYKRFLNIQSNNV